MSGAFPGCVLMRRARDVMRVATAHVSSTDHLDRAAELMATLAVRELPVVDDGVLVGILTRGDLDPYVGEREWTAVRVAMTPGPTTTTPDASVSAVAKALLAGNFNGIPVVAGTELAGMINRRDLLRLLAACPLDGER